MVGEWMGRLVFYTIFNNISFIKEINFIGAEKWSTRERKTSTFHKYLKKNRFIFVKRKFAMNLSSQE
jgi:hypothetical protein